MEYRVVAPRQTMGGDKIDTGKLQATLNEWGRQGWHVRAITAASVGEGSVPAASVVSSSRSNVPCLTNASIGRC